MIVGGYASTIPIVCGFLIGLIIMNPGTARDSSGNLWIAFGPFRMMLFIIFGCISIPTQNLFLLLIWLGFAAGGMTRTAIEFRRQSPQIYL
jgi:hypothetical protein